tara:strand:+ start:426 stop:668 length:243 start_codon:yes stop_codon:yes gene_type:complete
MLEVAVVELGHQVVGDPVIQQDLVEQAAVVMVEELILQEELKHLHYLVQQEQLTQAVAVVAQEDLTHQLVEHQVVVDQVL